MGAWNTAILNPNWLCKQIFELPKDKQIPIEISFDVKVSLKYTINDLIIIPGIEKLIIYPAREEEKLFESIVSATSLLYDKLPHTPITAIGHNFRYELTNDERFVDIGFDFTNEQEAFKSISSQDIQSTTIAHSLSLQEDKEVILKLNFQKTKDKSIIDLNYHYQVNNDDKKIKFALSNYFGNYKHSIAIKSNFIN